MDIDMDLDLGPLPEPEPIEMEQTLQATTATSADGMITDPQSAETQYEKVHIRGVDELTTENIKDFAFSNFPLEQPSRVEWIDDTSANIVYSTPEIGLQALAALTHDGELEDGIDASAPTVAGAEIPALRLRSAKVLASHPDSVLQVRAAVKSDKKKPRAYEASRFYMMHPEHDPRERLRRELATERRRSGGGDGDGDYHRRKFDNRELRRRRERDYEAGVTANMYDDTGATSTDRSDGDRDWDRGRRRRGSGRRERDMELFPDEGGKSGRLRDRSASPGRDTLMLEGGYMDERQETRRRFRERSPAPARRNEGRELFASSDGDANSRELFPNKTANTYLKKELFPTKVSNHRRSDAIDVADETADLFARRMSIPLVDGAQEANPRRNRNVELFPDSSNPDRAKKGGVNIRGAAGQDQGFSIRGAAENGISIKGRGGEAVRELFPSKFNSNAGKELFSDKIEGRGGPRRKAEDMFT
ncbi:hypothetical protein BJY04DRAFT_212761 [Aspergillus karnatakaensis]|uniref:NCBP3 domain-containing protein n=1 Tax=Aspergillus karnatakaensis TaxID=1810916 RepID=UPI003CCD0906